MGIAFGARESSKARGLYTQGSMPFLSGGSEVVVEKGRKRGKSRRSFDERLALFTGVGLNPEFRFHAKRKSSRDGVRVSKDESHGRAVLTACCSYCLVTLISMTAEE